ncbi:MAG: GntR family transcriptional regulator [Acetatifactor sp.]|nr:GntR family transcriptional regulator [Acetatifactor sp.]
MKIENQKPRDEAIEIIENYIISSGLQSGDKLPSERAMCEMWGVNRSTLRSAIKQLILEGVICNKKGSGTYVASEKLVRNLQDSYGFYQSAQKAGRSVRTRVIALETCETTKSIGKKIKLPLGHKLYRLVRLRFLDDVPVMLSNIYIDAERYPKMNEVNYEEKSFYTALYEIYGIKVSEGTEKLSIAYCDAREAEYLEVEEGAPVICQSGLALTQEGEFVEYFQEITRSEYIRFAIELTKK